MLISTIIEDMVYIQQLIPIIIEYIIVDFIIIEVMEYSWHPIEIFLVISNHTTIKIDEYVLVDNLIHSTIFSHITINE